MSSGKSSSGSWWSAALGFGGKAASVPDTDYADMGTAFGLDASLGKTHSQHEPRADERRAPVPAAAPPRRR
ncbi:hypothetical protein [Piscinibacter sp.]|uniref:hypothetical protein n=1 Tax=Piscinibacter sp. TaxID=1903157 RepID=UPI0039E58F45